MMAQLVWEAERSGNVAEICRRENIAPNLFYRWRQRLKQSGVEGLKAAKRGPKSKDVEKEQLKAEVARLKSALCESSIELHLLKKSVSSGYMGT
jgi:transposase-like protein